MKERASTSPSCSLFLHCFLVLGLSHLCEFIEDCEHTVLATRILHLLGREGPRSQQPGRYIRFIYNRVILENAAVRAGRYLGSVVYGAESDLPITDLQHVWRRGGCLWNLLYCFHHNKLHIILLAKYLVHKMHCQHITCISFLHGNDYLF